MTTPPAVPLPEVRGPLEVTPESHPFSTMRHARLPLDLAEYGWVEEEFIVSGTANVYGFAPDGHSLRIISPARPYATRVLVRRPREGVAARAWVSILNASQGYDIEDDWRRAWNYFISTGTPYVAVTSKPIQVSALRTFDPARYDSLTWDGVPRALDATAPGWNPFVVLDECEEGLIWDILAQVASWVRADDSGIGAGRVYLMGQSQSSIYANTFINHFHSVLRRGDGGPVFDGYAPGVGALLSKPVSQGPAGRPTSGTLELPDAVRAAGLDVEQLPPADVDVPVVSVSSEGDVTLFGGELPLFALGDAPLRRHWNVSGVPHSDARSRVIPANDQVERAQRLPRVLDEAYLESLLAVPLEPVITGQMRAVQRWAEEGVAAAPSRFFGDDPLVLGLVRYPLGDFSPAAEGNPVVGTMTLKPRDSIVDTYGSLDDYLALMDSHDDALEQAGYLEPIGRDLLRAVARELWGRAVEGKPAPQASPQRVITPAD